MSFPRYPKYKDSGVEWLGEVPEHWPIVSLRYIFENLDYKRVPLAGEDRANVEKIYPYYGASGIIDYVPDFLFDETLLLVAEDGANLLSRSTPLAFLASGKFWVNNHAHILKPRSGNVFFWTALLQTYDYTPIVTGAAQPKLTADRLGSIRLPIPTPPEQQAIAAFLDRETAKIDELVAEQRRLIELLKEKRQAVISHAVTKGLNPNVPLRPSGIEWLGNVPEHWDVFALKRGITKIGQGWSPQCENDVAAEGEWGVVKVGCCNRFNMVETEQKRLPAEITPMIEYEIQNGDILMSRGNTLDLVGMAAMATNVRPRLLLSDLVYRFRAVEDQFDAAFLVHSLRSKNVRTQVECEAVGSSATMKKVSQEVVRNFFVCKPSVLEQQEIASYLAAMSAEFDNLEAEAERAIELLQERRTALISAAVTGKIDVRGFAKKEGS